MNAFRIRRRTMVVTALGGTLIAASLTAASAVVNRVPPTDHGIAPPAAPLNVGEQLAENGATTASVAVSTAVTTQRVCAAEGARWLRLRFSELNLRAGDTVTLVPESGAGQTLTATNWTGRAFYTRAFQGRCAAVEPKLAHPASSYAVDAYQSGTQALTEATVTVAAAGDICGSACNQTAALVTNLNPTAVITAGDNAYESGSLSEFNTKYHPYWGAFKAKTYPSPGNHEYQTSGAAGYFDYFNGVGNQTGRAGERGKGYYSFDVGDWHFVALNSNISRSAGSTQEQWLRRDLAASTKPCVAAYWHHPRFAAGNYGDNETMRPLFQALYDARADLVISGHDHNYIRFAPSRPDGTRDTTNGLRQLLIGTGGRTLYGSGGSTRATIEKSNYNTFGVGKLTLTATGYTAEFVPVAGRTFTDSVTGQCRQKPALAGPRG